MRCLGTFFQGKLKYIDIGGGLGDFRATHGCWGRSQGGDAGREGERDL